MGFDVAAARQCNSEQLLSLFILRDLSIAPVPNSISPQSGIRQGLCDREKHSDRKTLVLSLLHRTEWSTVVGI